MFDGDALHAARKRDGAAAEDRPAEVDDVMSPCEKVGFKNELPLLQRDYDNYPTEGELYRPVEGDTLRTLVEHEKVQSVEDVAAELNVEKEAIEKAAELHDIGLTLGSDFDIDVDTPRLHALLGDDYPEELVDPDNPITVTTLYVGKGLGTNEIAEVFAEVTDRGSLPDEHIRQTLVDAGVIEGMGSEEQEHRMRQNRGRGLTVNVGEH
jgi:hypothetical protein